MTEVGQKEILTQRHIIQFFEIGLASADFVYFVSLEGSLIPPDELI